MTTPEDAGCEALPRLPVRVHCPYPFRSVQLVSRKRDKINSQRHHINWDIPDRPCGVGMEKGAVAMSDQCVSSDRVDRADFVVREHHGDKEHVVVDQLANGFSRELTDAIWKYFAHDDPVGLECRCGLYADSGKTTTAEPGTEYVILVYGELGTLVHTETGLTGTSWTYLEADEIAESGLGRLNDHLRVAIRTWGPSRTHEATRAIEWEFERV